MGRKKYVILYLPTGDYLYRLNKYNRISPEVDKLYTIHELTKKMHGYTLKDATKFFSSKELLRKYAQYWVNRYNDPIEKLVFSNELAVHALRAEHLLLMDYDTEEEVPLYEI